jgi:thymidylate synthase (FAD)
LQDTKNRQNSIELDVLNNLEHRELNNWWEEKQREIIKLTREVYKQATDMGIAKEQARAVLPEGLTVSKLYMAGTLRSWIHYIQLRSENGTQKEHIEVAKACAKVIAEVFPMSAEL